MYGEKRTLAFDKIVDDNSYKRASQRLMFKLGAESLGELKEDPFVIEIIALAKDGDPDAQQWLYRNCREAIAHVFWTKFLGPNRKMHAFRLKRGDDELFASHAWEWMVKYAIPSFDVSKYMQNPKNILGKFQYRLMQYLSNAALKLNKELRSAGITMIPKDVNVTQVSFPEDEEGKEIPSKEFSVSSEEHQLDEIYAIENYLKKLKSRISTNKKDFLMYKILLFKLENPQMDLKEIANVLGESYFSVKKAFNELKDELRRELMENSSFNSPTSRKKLFEESKKQSVKIPDWKPFEEASKKEALDFRKIEINPSLVHYISPIFLITETLNPVKKDQYQYIIYLRTGYPGDRNIKNKEYSSYVLPISTYWRNDGALIENLDQAKKICASYYEANRWRSNPHLKWELNGNFPPSSGKYDVTNTDFL
jgi:hypothetical protein